MSQCHAALHIEHDGIEWAQPDGTSEATNRLLGLPAKRSHPATVIPRCRQVRIQLERPIDHRNTVIESADHVGESTSAKTQGNRVILPNLSYASSEPRGFGRFRYRVGRPPIGLAAVVAPHGHGMSRTEIRVELDRL